MIGYQLARGKNLNTFTVLDEAGTITGIRSGVAADLFDNRPSNLIVFNTATNSGNDHVIINIDTGDGNLRQGFIALLNHNMKTADAKMRVYASDDPDDLDAVNISAGSAAAVAMTEIVNGVPNADSDGTALVTPRHDGSTIVTFSERHERYFGIQFEGTAGSGSDEFNTSTHMTLGSLMIGEYFDMPVAPDLSLTRSITYDHVKVQESIGGQRYANISSFGRQVSAASKSPFSTTTSNQQIFGGRMGLDLSFSYLNSTDLMPDEYDTYNFTDDSFVEDVWNRTMGPALPFVLSVDKTLSGDGNDGEHLFCRFAQDGLSMQQVMPDIFSVKLKIEEEF